MAELTRGERLQIMLTEEELQLIDDWRFRTRMPSRAAAIRELIRRGLKAEGFRMAESGVRSGAYGIKEGDGDGAAIDGKSPRRR
jgi:hypothetical protein